MTEVTEVAAAAAGNGLGRADEARVIAGGECSRRGGDRHGGGVHGRGRDRGQIEGSATTRIGSQIPREMKRMLNQKKRRIVRIRLERKGQGQDPPPAARGLAPAAAEVARSRGTPEVPAPSTRLVQA